MATLKVTVSLDDEWASENISHTGHDWLTMLRKCQVFDSGKIMDPNGNTVGKWEVTEGD